MNRGYDYKKFAVLYVDDEEQALKYFGKAFSEDFQVLTAPNAQRAIDILEEPDSEPVGVLITDQRMPGQTGVDLLGKVRKTRPDIIRIITTAYSDLDDAIDAVNSGAVFRYIAKPWDIRELRTVLLTAMEFFQVQRERDILLREKLGVLQRMIILDRVRSFTVLAASLTCRVRNSMTALKAFFDLVPVGVGEKLADSSMDWGDLWTLAQTESQRLVDAVDEVVNATVDSDYTFSHSVQLADLVRDQIDVNAHTWQQKGVRFDLDLSQVPPVTGDQRMIARLMDILLSRQAALINEPSSIKISMQQTDLRGDSSGVRVLFTGGPQPWDAAQIESLFSAVTPANAQPRDLGLDMLAAFFIAHHHGGDLRIHPAPPLGPGFELLLPLDPENAQRPPLESDWLDRIFTTLEAWGRLNAGV